mmetsp:Transcript_7760/g.32693  ORF Transcript_7760/g.32693 Transcript_7760/m.32693 type:complete len:284 (-) Transcript_7760:154-1005(-)
MALLALLADVTVVVQQLHVRELVLFAKHKLFTSGDVAQGHELQHAITVPQQGIRGSPVIYQFVNRMEALEFLFIQLARGHSRPPNSLRPLECCAVVVHLRESLGIVLSKRAEDVIMVFLHERLRLLRIGVELGALEHCDLLLVPVERCGEAGRENVDPSSHFRRSHARLSSVVGSPPMKEQQQGEEGTLVRKESHSKRGLRSGHSLFEGERSGRDRIRERLARATRKEERQRLLGKPPENVTLCYGRRGHCADDGLLLLPLALFQLPQVHSDGFFHVMSSVRL